MEQKHPSQEECFALLKQYQTPHHVIRHCVKVAETALKIGDALNMKGFNLDLDLIQAAALIHDIARTENRHWEVGADIVRGFGYVQEAEIIRVHMHYNCNPNEETINETDIICLSDRLVKEDEYVGLEARMQYILDKYNENQEAIQRINKGFKNNKAVIQKIEMIIGTTIDAIM